jgi:pantothenate kinase
MDGYHLSNRELRRLGRADRKGAIDTFDAAGYLSLARRLAANEPVVYAPEFDRSIEEPIAGSIRIDRSVRLVICEGNYLLVEQPPWNELRALFAESWYCDLPEEIRLSRLIDRHHAFGKSLDAARAWALGTDQTNADLIATSRSRADVLAATG